MPTRVGETLVISLSRCANTAFHKCLSTSARLNRSRIPGFVVAMVIQGKVVARN